MARPARVVLPAVLRPYASGSAELQIPVRIGASVADVLDAVGDAYPALARRIRDERGALRRYVNVFVDGEDVRGAGGPSAPVPPGAEVLVLPSVAGG